ncbi:HDOD domain-containing protein, partial [bacterium]|nr:HDOD domain-containing protein [bacterium]
IYAEQNLVGIDHTEIGACIAEKWNFSKNLIFLIENHHNHLDKDNQNTDTALLHLTDYLINQDHIGMFDNFPINCTLNTSCLEILNISYNIIPEFKEKIIQSFEEI